MGQSFRSSVLYDYGINPGHQIEFDWDGGRYAAEKVLKALLVQRQIDFPRTHSIGALLALCEEVGFTGPQELVDASSLTRYAVATRYPGEEEPVSRQEAREAAALAAQVFVWVFTQIHSHPQP